MLGLDKIILSLRISFCLILVPPYVVLRLQVQASKNILDLKFTLKVNCFFVLKQKGLKQISIKTVFKYLIQYQLKVWPTNGLSTKQWSGREPSSTV